MEIEKVKNIKKALEFNANEDIYVLPYVDDNDNQNIVDFNDILTYINELESENERLSNTEIGELIKENEELAKQCEDWCEITLRKRNRIIELKSLIAELESENENLRAIVKAHKYCVTPKHCLEAKSLKDRITDLKKENAELKVDLKNSIDMQKQMLGGFKAATKEIKESLAIEIPKLLKQFGIEIKEE